MDLATGAQVDFQSSLTVDHTIDSGGVPGVVVAGLTNGVPTFTLGQYQSGATLTQNTNSLFYTVTFLDGSSVVFGYRSRLLSTTDSHGYTQTYGYNSSSLLASITDSLNQRINLNYTNINNSTLLASAVGTNLYSRAGSVTNTESVTYHYDAGNRLYSVVHNRSQAILAEYAYNATNQLSSVTNLYGLSPITTIADLKGRSTNRTMCWGIPAPSSLEKHQRSVAGVGRHDIDTVYTRKKAPTAWDEQHIKGMCSTT